MNNIKHAMCLSAVLCGALAAHSFAATIPVNAGEQADSWPDMPEEVKHSLAAMTAGYWRALPARIKAANPMARLPGKAGP